MQSTTRLFVLIAGMIVSFDALGATASRLFGFNYSNLLYGSIVLYVLSGYLGFRYRRLVGGFQAGLIAGLVDSTAGWGLAVAINPQLRTHPTIFIISTTIVLVTLLGGLLGLAAAAIAKAFSLMQTDSITRH